MTAGAVVTIGVASQPADALDVDPRLFGPGVYHLMQAGRVVYIGATSNLAQRISAWRTCEWFDSARVIPADLDSLPALEREHIARYRPEQNRAGVTWPYMSPAARWRNARRYSVKIDKVDVYSRAAAVRALKRDLTLAHLATMRLIPCGLQRGERFTALAHIGFPPPDYSTGKGFPRWLPSSVLSWLAAHGPFEDELEAAA